MLLPFYAGAAVLAVLFPLFILVACDSDPTAVHARQVQTGSQAHPGGGGAAAGLQPAAVVTVAALKDRRAVDSSQVIVLQLGRLPIFYAARWPTEWLLAAAFGQRRSRFRA